MNDFIPYEESAELKKLGFKERCFFAFDHCSTPMRCTDLRTNDHKFNGVNYNSSTYTSQPTFAQAFKWFREKHKIDAGCVRSLPKPHESWHAEISYLRDDILNKGKQYEVKLQIYPNWDRGVEESGTYEEAEFACLKELIKIVKQNETSKA